MGICVLFLIGASGVVDHSQGIWRERRGPEESGCVGQDLLLAFFHRKSVSEWVDWKYL